jgi:beta-lactamase regulating signal transducer with metallopeptidase domain
METFALAATRFGLDITLKATLLLALVLCLVAAIRRASAALRHLAAMLGLAGALALPVVTLFAPRISVPLVPSFLPPGLSEATPAPSVGATEKAVPRAIPASNGTDEPWFSAPAGTATAASNVRPFHAEIAVGVPCLASDATGHAAPISATRPPAWAPWALAIWAAGVLLASIRLWFGWLRVRAIARRAEPIRHQESLETAANIARQLSLKTQVRILMSGSVPVAITAGALRPVLVLNSSSCRWPADLRRVVFLHELAHVRRRDWITLLLGELAVGLYWFHPLVWLARREMRRNSERACDDMVIGEGTKPSVYAAHLLDIVRSLAPDARTALPVMAMARPSQFEGRVRAMLDPDLRRQSPSGRQVRASAVGLFASILVLSALEPWAPRGVEASQQKTRAAEEASIPLALASPAVVLLSSAQPVPTATCKPKTTRAPAKKKCSKKPAGSASPSPARSEKS